MSETYRELITTPNPTAVTYEDYVRGIEDLFSRLADAGVYKGDRGENLKAAPINLLSQPESTPLTYNSFTEEGKRLLNAIFDDINPATVFVEGGTQTEMIKKLNFFNSVNTYTWWCTDGDTDKKVFPSTAFVYIDPNAAVRDIRDYSCLLTPKLELNGSTGLYELHYSKSEVFPSFWYNPLVFNGKGGWCWRINGVNTDIPASAANDTGEYNNKLFLIRKFTEETTETFKYYTSINNTVDWYTLEELKNAKKRTPLDGDIGYYLVQTVQSRTEPGSNPPQREDVAITVINLAVYSGGNWIPASIDGTDVLMKFDELFASYIWDCLSYKTVVVDNLFIGTRGTEVHKIAVNSDNFRQLDFTFTGVPYEDDPEAADDKKRRDQIISELERLNSEYVSASEANRPQIMNSFNKLSAELREIESNFENHEEGINFTANYKHLNFGAKDNVGSATKVNIYSDAIFNKEGKTTFRNNVVFDGNDISSDSESSAYEKPSLTINGYSHIDISNITPSETNEVKIDPIHISADIGVGGKLSIEGDLEVEDINSNSVTCNGTLRGERLNVRGVTTNDGLVSMSKAIISKNGRAITAVPEDISSSNITKYLGAGSKTTYLNSIGRTYLGDYVSTGSKSGNSASISRSNNSRYVFGETTVPANNILEFTYKGYGVVASIYYQHFTDVDFSASMSYQIQARLRDSNGNPMSNWITFYSGGVSNQKGSASGNNDTWRTTYKYLICSLANGNLESEGLSSYYTIVRNTSSGKIIITPTDSAGNIGGFDFRVVVNSISSSVSDNTAWWKGVGGVGIGNIGITSNVTSGSFINSASIGNYINLYTTPTSSDKAQAVLFSNALLIGNASSYFYFKMKDNRVRIFGKGGSGVETSQLIFDPANPKSDSSV